MKVSVRSDKVIIDGYVNAVDRFSRPLFEGKLGKFIEKILPNVFKRAIAKAQNIDVLLNHDEDRLLACTSDGTAKIYEDNVGLRATVEITDPEVIEKAKAGKLRGWSFGFSDPTDEVRTNADGIIERIVKSLTLHEVSIIDDRALPAYIGTSIEARAISDGIVVEVRMAEDTEIDTEALPADPATPPKENTTPPDNAKIEEDAELEKQRIHRENVIREVSI